jgi:hypothetical protein
VAAATLVLPSLLRRTLVRARPDYVALSPFAMERAGHLNVLRASGWALQFPRWQVYVRLVGERHGSSRTTRWAGPVNSSGGGGADQEEEPRRIERWVQMCVGGCLTASSSWWVPAGETDVRADTGQMRRWWPLAHLELLLRSSLRKDWASRAVTW